MLKLRDIEARLGVINAEMRALYDGAETAGESDLSGEKLEKWNTLKTERDDLAAKGARARLRDELDRRAEARPAGEKRPGDAWGLLREQRMSDVVHAQTGESCEGLSFGRALHARLTGNWKGAEAEHRVMGSTPDTAGGYFLPSPVSANIIDLARNASVLNQAGAVAVPMTGSSLRLVRVMTDPTAAWRGEGEAITESDASFGSLNISPQSLAALVRVNAELLDDAPNFASTIDAQLAAALGLKLDYAGLYGSGASNQPLGLRNVTTANGMNEVSMGTNGAAATSYDEYLDLIQAVQEDNGQPSAVIMSPRTATKLQKLVTGITGDKTKLVPPSGFTALTRIVSNQVSITETQGSSNVASTSFVGGFSNMAVCMRQQIQIEATRTAGDDTFARNQVLVRAILRADIAVLRPNHFGRIVGIL